MITIYVKDAPLQKNPHKIEVHRLYDHDNAQAMHITLQAGQSLIPHITPVDVFFYVLEGTPEIQVGNEKLTVEKDNLVESPKDIVHCIANKSDSVVRILVIKAPKPTTKTILV